MQQEQQPDTHRLSYDHAHNQRNDSSAPNTRTSARSPPAPISSEFQERRISQEPGWTTDRYPRDPGSGFILEGTQPARSSQPQDRECRCCRERRDTAPATAPELQYRASDQGARTKHATDSPKEPLFRQIQTDGPKNIVIFGETGTGKSSLVNMLSDNDVAIVSNKALGCTFESTGYPVTIDDKQYVLWDTAGLNEGDAGSVPGDEALQHLRGLVEKLKDGLSLLVYCIRGTRYRDIIKDNYVLFTKIICQGEIPVVIVVTGLENEDHMEGWWDANGNEFTKRNIHFAGHACVTTSKGKKNMFEEEYEESRDAVRALIKRCCSDNDAWVIDSDLWFRRITDSIWRYYGYYSVHPQVPMTGDTEEEWRPSLLFRIPRAIVEILKCLLVAGYLQVRRGEGWSSSP